MIEPASAVPSDAPRFVIVFWMPPTSGLSSSGHGGDRDGAELRGERADAEPDQQHRHEDDLRARVGVERREQDDRAGEQREQPAADDEPRRDVREEARDPDRRDQQRDRQRQEPRARRERGQPEADRQVQRYDEEDPACTRYWKKNIVRPPLSCRFRSIAGRPAAPRRGRPRRASQRRKSQITNRPASISHTSARAPPRRARRPSAGSSPTRPSGDAEDEHARARRGEHGADDVELRALLGPARRRSAARSAGSPSDHHDLTGEDPPPREVGRAEPADQRPDRDRDRARGRDEPVGGGRRSAAKLPRRARRSRAGSVPRRPLEERPAEQQHRQVRRERRANEPQP